MRRNARLPLIILLLFMPLIALLNLMLGASGLSLAEIWQALILQDTFSRSYVILMHIRLPRLLGAQQSGALRLFSRFRRRARSFDAIRPLSLLWEHCFDLILMW